MILHSLGQPKSIGGEQRAEISELGNKMIGSNRDLETFFTKMPFFASNKMTKGSLRLIFQKLHHSKYY